MCYVKQSNGAQITENSKCHFFQLIDNSDIFLLNCNCDKQIGEVSYIRIQIVRKSWKKT